MTDAVCANTRTTTPTAVRSRRLADREDAALRETLKHFSGCTYYAAYQFRLTGDPGRIPTLVRGVIERYVEPELRGRLGHPEGGLLLGRDLGIDSLDLVEIAGIFEDVLQTTIPDCEMRALRTLADIRQCVESRVAKSTGRRVAASG